MSGLRFAMVTTFYPPHNFGGDGIAIQRLSQALARRGHGVTVLHDVDAFKVLTGRDISGEQPQLDGVEVRSLRSPLGPISPVLTHQFGHPVANGRKIREELNAGRFDVIHFNNVSLVGGPGVLSAGTALKAYEAHEHWLVCPTHVLWRHNREPCPDRQCLRCVLRHKRPPQLWRYTGRLKKHLRHVDVFIAKSEFSRLKHMEFGFPREMEVLPYFLPDVETRRVPAAPPHPKPYFLFVGRLERIKGVDSLIPVFARYEKADLVVVGDGEEEAALKSMAGDSKRIRFVGRVHPADLASYYEHAAAVVVPSQCFETFGIVLIEAFRQGTPVIARRLGPFPELIEQSSGGILFDSDEQLGATLDRLLSDGALREKLSVGARESFLRLWSEDAVIPRYLEILRQAAERKGMVRLMDRLGLAA